MKLTRTFVALLAGSCIALPAFACINTFKTEIARFKAQGDSAAIAKVVGDLEKAHAQKPTVETGNDLGAARVLTGKYPEAIALLRATEEKFPGNAKVAANLGTALELAGQNEEALKWIREGVIRDANEHNGSEWLHARILEAKIAIAKDPAWLQKNRVLQLDFGTADVPAAPGILPIDKDGKLKGVDQLLSQIQYQLNERTSFVAPPDAVIGDVLASAGDLAIAGGASPLVDPDAVADPQRYYERALTYGAPHADRIRARLARYQKDLAALPPPEPKPESDVVDYPDAAAEPERGPRGWWLAFIIVPIVFGIGIYEWNRRVRRKAA